jgi:group I intron endonuclease
MTPLLVLKDRPLIYCILNTSNGKVYVGKTKCIYRRCHQYIYNFVNKNLKGINRYLLSAMKRDGIENFKMFPLQFCSIDELQSLELEWMDRLHSCDRNRGYNLRRDSSTGVVTHDLTRKKYSERLKQEWASGKRSNHSNKMKESWKKRDKTSQSKLLSDIKTKYQYRVTCSEGKSVDVNYKQLRELKLESALSAFHRKKTASVKVKGYQIDRIEI